MHLARPSSPRSLSAFCLILLLKFIASFVKQKCAIEEKEKSISNFFIKMYFMQIYANEK